MSRVIFKVIAGDGFTGNLNGNKDSAEFMNGEFMLYAVSGGTFNTKTGAVTASNAYKTYTLSGTNIDAPGDAHCLYLVTDTGISITSIIANESNHTKWEPGYTYTYNVICKKEGMNLLLSSIKPWVNGGEGTLTPTE